MDELEYSRLQIELIKSVCEKFEQLPLKLWKLNLVQMNRCTGAYLPSLMIIEFRLLGGRAS